MPSLITHFVGQIFQKCKNINQINSENTALVNLTHNTFVYWPCGKTYEEDTPS